MQKICCIQEFVEELTKVVAKLSPGGEAEVS
jgi:hypothetical protein